MTRKRVLILSFTFPPNADGVSYSAYRLAQALAERGCTVGVVTEFHPQRDLAAYPPLTVRHFNIRGVTFNWRDPVRGETRECETFLAEFQPDIVFCECWEPWTTALALRVFRRGKAKLVVVSHGYTCHQINWYRRFPFGLVRWLARLPFVLATPFIMRRLSWVVFNSERRDFGRFFDRILADLAGYSNTVVLPNPLDLTEFERATPDFRQAHRLGAGPMFLCIANYSERKNQELALRAFRKAAIPGSTIVFIGSDFNDYSARLIEADAALRVAGAQTGTAVFLEKVERSMVIAALKACDVFVLTARAETMPVALIEAMAAGKPFVSTDTGCVSEMAGGVVVKDEAGFLQAITALASDPQRRAELGAKGRVACIEGWSMEKIGDRFRALCDDPPQEKSRASSAN